MHSGNSDPEPESRWQLLHRLDPDQRRRLVREHDQPDLGDRQRARAHHAHVQRPLPRTERLQPGASSGFFREDISYDGTSTTCTSGNQSWSAAFFNQGNQAALAPPAGGYTGPTSQDAANALSLTVSADSSQLQNVTINFVALACTPATPTHNPSPDNSFGITSIPINADGSFSGTVAQAGVEGGAPVHFTYSFSGHFNGRNASNKERIAGMFREDITYDGTSTVCTSGNQFGRPRPTVTRRTRLADGQVELLSLRIA